MANKKQTKRIVKYTNKKTGVTKIYEYNYYVEKGGKRKGQKQTFKSSTIKVQKRQGKTLTREQAINFLKENNYTPTQIVEVKNELLYDPEYEDGITEKSLYRLVRQSVKDANVRFIRNAGYTVDEFAEEFGTTVSDLESGEAKIITQNGVTTLTTASGLTYTFDWNYEKGLVRKW